MNQPKKATNDQEPKQNGPNDVQLKFNAFKHFLTSNITRLERIKKDTGERVTMVDLTSCISGTAYSYYLRENYVIDSRSLLKRLNLFLYQCPDTFTVNYETGEVRFTNDNEKVSLKKKIVELCSDFLILCLSFQSDCLIPIKQLHQYLIYASDLVQNYLKDYDFFLDFLKCEKDLFYIEDDYICQADQKVRLEKRKFDLFRREETRIDEKLNDKVCFVYNLDMGKRIRNHVLSGVKMIAIDTEGTHLGSIDGMMTLIQIAFLDKKIPDLEQTTIIDNMHIYFFDVLRCPYLVEECIKPIIESKDVIKILHDSRNDFMAFESYYGIREIHNIFDSSKSYVKLSNSTTNGLHTIYEEVTGLTGQNLKPKMKQLYQQNDRLWEDRPLTDFLKFYAAMDVLALLSIYLHLEVKYDFSKFKKSELFIETIASTAPKVVYTEDCVIADDYYGSEEEEMFYQKMNGEDAIKKAPIPKKKNKPKKKKYNKFDFPGNSEAPHPEGPHSNPQKTVEDLEKLRKRFANLERLARGEEKVRSK